MKPSLVSLAVLALGCYAQDRSTEEAEAQITDPNQECSPYYYAPVSLHTSSFPTIWQPASILPNDSAAQALWQSIQPNIPNIQPKPSPQIITSTSGSTNNTTPTPSNFTYDPTDPDCWWSYHQCTTPKLAGLSPDIVNVPEPLTMGFGFDDGPNCSHNAFYDFLASKNQKATMYYIGSNVMDWPLEAQRGLADGHEICVHTWSHRYMTSFSSPDAFAELYYTIKLAVGVTPTCWRPPFGDVDDRIRAIAKGLGLQTIIWDYDSNDWRYGIGGTTKAQVDSNYETFINMATSGQFSSHGGIMLTHELNNFTMSEMVEFYPQLESAFKYMVPVGVAYNKTQPYVEKNYTLPTFEQYISGLTTSNSSAASSGSGSDKKAGAATVALPMSQIAKILVVSTALFLL
ncbi:hypothetical protein NP233_g1798 [Leucocoprinus birnbaumii]|uniref:chitin deacetylase n=1 Tax=Leucocoprinus birnbaumii TaxID=56174 RepID=A0AAD5VZG8_9AGAR|nr:hypothetical protein NP233_g1798 [Leucocoprinus birnbaumii]